VRLIDLYLSQRRPSLVIDAYISEQPVAQRLLLEIYRRPDGDGNGPITGPDIGMLTSPPEQDASRARKTRPGYCK